MAGSSQAFEGVRALRGVPASVRCKHFRQWRSRGVLEAFSRRSRGVLEASRGIRGGHSRVRSEAFGGVRARSGAFGGVRACLGRFFEAAIDFGAIGRHGGVVSFIFHCLFMYFWTFCFPNSTQSLVRLRILKQGLYLVGPETAKQL